MTGVLRTHDMNGIGSPLGPHWPRGLFFVGATYERNLLSHHDEADELPAIGSSTVRC